jgi:hypothetical protein
MIVVISPLHQQCDCEGKCLRRLENYTFLTPGIQVRKTNVVVGLKKPI